MRESTPPPAPRLYAIGETMLDLEQLVAVCPTTATLTGERVEIRFACGLALTTSASAAVDLKRAWREYRGC